ncbi:MAG: RDD family protein [Caldilineaceae bacterium]
MYALINFAIIWGYYMAFELLWNGQSPGKRVANTQVVRANGAPAEFGEVAIRNVVRIIDFLPFAYAIGFVVMFLNRRSRRLGDFAANTLVIKRQDQVKLSDLVGPAQASGTGTQPGTFTPAGPSTPMNTITPPGPTAATPPPVSVSAETLAHFPNLSQMSEDEYQLVRETLTRDAAGKADANLLRRLAAAMAARVGALPPAPDRYSSRAFLALLADAYKAVNSQGDDSTS